MSKHLFIGGPWDGEFHNVPRVGTAFSLQTHEVKVAGLRCVYHREPFYFHNRTFDIFISMDTQRDKRLNERVVSIILDRAGGSLDGDHD